MTITLKRLAQAALGAAASASLYAPASGKTGMLKSLTLCNTTDADVLARVHLVPSGGSASASNALFYDATVPAKSTFDWAGLHVLAAGDSLRASGVGITLTASGAEQ